MMQGSLPRSMNASTCSTGLGLTRRSESLASSSNLLWTVVARPEPTSSCWTSLLVSLLAASIEGLAEFAQILAEFVGELGEHRLGAHDRLVELLGESVELSRARVLRRRGLGLRGLGDVLDQRLRDIEVASPLVVGVDRTEDFLVDQLLVGRRIVDQHLPARPHGFGPVDDREQFVPQ
ncbi:MAG: hypothetical protein ABEN55_09375 [Bradymonadaceae bacterium]